MDIATETEFYCPAIDEMGNYIDSIPPNHKNGIRCPCGSRRDKIYYNFPTHIKTKTHQKWIAELTNNKQNYFLENEKLRNLVQNQRIIIAELEKQISSKNLTIECLTEKIGQMKASAYQTTNINLIDI